MSLPTDSLPSTPAGAIAGRLTELHTKWGWFVALGLVLIVAGVIALGNLILGTFATVFYVGVVMAVAGIAEVVHAFQVKSWGAFLFWLLAGILYVGAGLITVGNPLLAAGVLTLVLGISLIVSGVFRLIAAFQARPHEGWGWLALSSAITLLLGIEITIRWPVNALWILGLFLGIDLLFNGVAVLLIGLRLKK